MFSAGSNPWSSAKNAQFWNLTKVKRKNTVKWHFNHLKKTFNIVCSEIMIRQIKFLIVFALLLSILWCTKTIQNFVRQIIFSEQTIIIVIFILGHNGICLWPRKIVVVSDRIWPLAKKLNPYFQHNRRFYKYIQTDVDQSPQRKCAIKSAFVPIYSKYRVQGLPHTILALYRSLHTLSVFC